MTAGIRQAVFVTLDSSPELKSLGFSDGSVHPGRSDSPSTDRFIVIRWGATKREVGSAKSTTVEFWVYNRQADYGLILNAIDVIKVLISSLESFVLIGNGVSILGVSWDGDSPDGFDPSWNAVFKSSSFRITFSES